MIKFLKKTGLCAMALFLFACGDSDLLKFDNLEGVKNWEPDFKLQLAHADYDLWRLIEQTDNEDSTLIRKEDNQIVIRYFQKDIASLNVSEVVEFPEEIVHLNFEASLDTLIGVQIPEGTTFELKKGVVPFNFENGVLTKVEGSLKCRYDFLTPSFYTITVEFINVFLVDTKQPLRFTFPNKVDTGEAQKVVFDMTSSPNQLQWKASITIQEAVTMSPINQSIDVRLKDFSFTRVEGTMKTQEVEIKEGEFDMGVEFWNNFAGSFNFAAPKVDLIVRNYGLGVPVQMDMDFVAYGENGQTVNLEAEKLMFEGWKGENEVVETQSYDTTNSNIAELLSLPPKEKITYGGKVIVGPDSTQPITILNTGEVNADAYVEIPLYLKVKGLMFRDTIDDISISDADKIKEAEIVVIADNQIPLGLESGYLYLLDGAKNCIDSVKIERFLDAPEIDADGNVLPSEDGKVTPPIVLNEKNILHLNETKYIVISVEAITSDNGERPVFIKADATLSLKLILGAKLNLEDIF